METEGDGNLREQIGRPARSDASKLGGAVDDHGNAGLLPEGLPGLVRHRPGRTRRHGHDDAGAIEHRDARAASAASSIQSVGRHVGEVHAVAALLDGDGRRDERQRGQDGERPVGGRPARGGENGADQRCRARTGGHHAVAWHPESLGEAFLELGDQRAPVRVAPAGVDSGQ